MNGGAEVLAAAMEAVLLPGDEVTPEGLLRALSVHFDPIPALSNRDLGNEFFGALDTQFPFVRRFQSMNEALCPEDTDQLAALLRWLIREFLEWNEAADPHLHKLTALFVTVQFCDLAGNFWDVFPGNLSGNAELLTQLERLVMNSSISFSTRSSQPAPIWEDEAVDRLTKADEARDWAAIADMWRQFDHTLFPGVVLTHSVRILSCFGFQNLVRAVSNIQQTATAMAVIRCLPVMKLGAASENPFVQFAAVYITGSRDPQADPLSIIEQGALSELLIRIATEGPRWAAWMKAFNRFPVRYPSLQAALGRTLCSASDTAIERYVEAISLSTAGISGCRQAVTECLRVFRNSASVERRKALWFMSHDRWKRWRFGADEEDTKLTEIAYSQVDFALVGYAVECIDVAERQAAIDDIVTRLNVIDKNWYANIVECLAAWNRLLSEYQLYAHAQAEAVAGTDRNWLLVDKQYLPFDSKLDRYNAIKFSMP